jgi:alpha-galactosidase
MNAPLFISADLRSLGEEAKSILLNREVIAVNQDLLAVPGRRIRNDGDVQVFAKPLKNGRAVALLNRGSNPAEIRVTAAELGLDKSVMEIRDLWTGQSQHITNGTIGAVAEPHGVKMFRVSDSGRGPR